jgi:hypothetical protein
MKTVIIDENFIRGFRNQVTVLTKLQKAVSYAIEDTGKKIDQLEKNKGRKIEDVIHPDRPAARREDGKGQR